MDDRTVEDAVRQRRDAQRPPATIGHLNPVQVRALRRIDKTGFDYEASAHTIGSLIGRGAIVRAAGVADNLFVLTDAARAAMAAQEEKTFTFCGACDTDVIGARCTCGGSE